MAGAGPDPEGELWRDGVAVLRATAAGDWTAVGFLLDSTASLRGLAEMVLGFSFEVWIESMAVAYPGASREEIARLVEELLTGALRDGPARETAPQDGGCP